MKMIVFSLLIICSVTISAQEIIVFEYKENFGRFTLSLNYDIVSSAKKYYFKLSYIGEDYQAYRSIHLIIDERNNYDHWLLFTNIDQTWTGIATETCRTAYLKDATITALGNANSIEFRLDAVRFRRTDIKTLSNAAITQISQFLR